MKIINSPSTKSRVKSLSIALCQLLIIFLLASCTTNKNTFDASGSFEAEETIISSEATGTIKQFTIEEGQELKAGAVIGYVDSTQLYLKVKQLQEQITALLSKRPNISVQLAFLEAQLKISQREQLRITNLVKGDAATTKQLDDINGQVELNKKQIEALKSTNEIAFTGLNKDTAPLSAQIAQTRDQLAKCKLINPTNGTVLTKYAGVNEMASQGKALYKIADLSTITLRAYITGNQLPVVKLNQKVKVNTDDGKGGFKKTEGVITFINDKAEFTPKTVQTKDERANLVYAIKVQVKNDGSYKIGMYGEIKF
jgi:HlyD family secretion protein